MITALAGGVGAARFLTGLTRLVKQEDISVIVNTGDDMDMFGLHISPDIDIVTYTLAGIVDEQKGWGVKDDTFQCLDMLKKLGLRHMVCPRRQRHRHTYFPNKPIKKRLLALPSYRANLRRFGA